MTPFSRVTLAAIIVLSSVASSSTRAHAGPRENVPPSGSDMKKKITSLLAERKKQQELLKRAIAQCSECPVRDQQKVMKVARLLYPEFSALKDDELQAAALAKWPAEKRDGRTVTPGGLAYMQFFQTEFLSHLLEHPDAVGPLNGPTRISIKRRLEPIEGMKTEIVNLELQLKQLRKQLAPNDKGQNSEITALLALIDQAKNPTTELAALPEKKVSDSKVKLEGTMTIPEQKIGSALVSDALGPSH